MIIILLWDKVCFRQFQITDYLITTQRELHTIKRVNRVDFNRSIDAHFRKKKQPHRLWSPRVHHTKEIKLDQYLGNGQPLGLPHSPTINPRIEIGTQKKCEETTSLIPIQPPIAIGPFIFSHPYMHIDRFYSIPSVTKEEFCGEGILADAWVVYQEVQTFTGLFQHMLLLNSFAYWDIVEQEIRAEGFHPKGLTVAEFIKWELLRHSFGIQKFTDAERFFSHFDKRLLASAFEKPDFIPRPYHASHYYKWLKPVHFATFFRKLVEDCVKFKIIIPRIAIADGLIYRTWAGNFTLDRWGNPTDPQATITVHNQKKLGKCYNAIVFLAWCGTRWLPVDLRVITGSANENTMFEPLVNDFLVASPYNWDVFLYDAGASSASNRQFLKDEGIIPGISARSNIVREVILDIDHKRFCYAEDIPDGMSLEQFKRLMNHRSQEEASFSGFTTYNHMKQMNTMGQDAATIHVLKYLILQLMHALAAYKVNRPDLLMMYSAFSALE